jgi:hypothetical protein
MDSRPTSIIIWIGKKSNGIPHRHLLTLTNLKRTGEHVTYDHRYYFASSICFNYDRTAVATVTFCFLYPTIARGHSRTMFLLPTTVSSIQAQVSIGRGARRG